MRVPFRVPPPSGRTVDAVGVGLNSVDLIALVAEHPRPDTKHRLEALARLPGGQAATAMVACARLGWRARYVGKFGGDEVGTFGRDSLVREGVDVSAAITVSGATNQFAIILVDSRTAQRTVMWHRHPALALTPAEVPPAAVTSGRILLVDCHETAAATAAARLARGAGMLTVIDVEKVRPGIEELLDEIDVIIASQAFPSEFTGRTGVGEALQALGQRFRAHVVCATLGPEGSLARCQDREIRTPGFKVDAVDSTGAGDVFRGGFIAGCLAMGRDGALEDLLTYANAVAALKCRRLGAREGIPSHDEVAVLVGSRAGQG